MVNFLLDSGIPCLGISCVTKSPIRADTPYVICESPPPRVLMSFNVMSWGEILGVLYQPRWYVVNDGNKL